MRTYIIVGGHGGIGMAMIKQLLENNPNTLIHATHLKSNPLYVHKRLLWHRLNASNEAEVARFASDAHIDSGLDGIVNCAGVLHADGKMPEKSIREFDADFFTENIRTNTLPTLLLAKHFSKMMKHERPCVFASLSARVGSISENGLGGWLSYRSSKAALNMVLKTLAIEWRRTHKNVCVAALHPGTTDTSLSQPFQRSVPAEKLFSPEKTAGYLWQLLSRLSPEDSGKFWSWSGDELPW